MIILGGHLIDKDAIYTPAAFPGFGRKSRSKGFAVARAVKKHAAR